MENSMDSDRGSIQQYKDHLEDMFLGLHKSVTGYKNEMFGQ
jgi:hypothetical protein